MKRLLFLLLSLLALTPMAGAQELYVKNRPFKGQVVASGNDLLVEAEPLFLALKLKFALVDGQIQIQDKSLPITPGTSGKNLVSLHQLATAAGLTVRKNPEFGYTDVYPGVDESELGPTSYTSPLTGFSIKAPPGYQVKSNPTLLTDVRRTTTTKAEQDGVFSFEAFIIPQPKGASSGTMMLATVTLADPLTTQDAPTVAKSLANRMAKKGGKPITGPNEVSVGDQRFLKLELEMFQNEITEQAELYMSYRPGSRIVYVFVIFDEESPFPTTSKALRPALATLIVTK